MAISAAERRQQEMDAKTEEASELMHGSDLNKIDGYTQTKLASDKMDVSSNSSKNMDEAADNYKI